MGKIRRQNQLEANLDGIDNMFVRDALSNLLDFVSTLSGTGLETKGDVRCSGVAIGDGPVIRTHVFSGTLDPMADRSFLFKDDVVNVSGFYRIAKGDQRAGSIIDFHVYTGVALIRSSMSLSDLEAVWSFATSNSLGTSIALSNSSSDAVAHYRLIVQTMDGRI